ncbi:hypothetical protein [Streptomyces huiliensis]|uniref:hypothetical protein n=1 Tax=Streptomyces huiliensis TaxID=2876027 RepID=UPI001CBB5F7A|nr:hypothetical protein [Streptomyces huiliensis]MBZ4319407.1 hypothetical protein [Streptomyces huiliensis]
MNPSSFAQACACSARTPSADRRSGRSTTPSVAKEPLMDDEVVTVELDRLEWEHYYT